MAKKKPTKKTDLPQEQTPSPLDEAARQRAEYVLRSQGHAIGCLPSLPAWMQAALSELVGVDGVLVADVRERVAELFERYYDEQKAVVDHPPSPPEE